jgi:hypothetical protein
MPLRATVAAARLRFVYSHEPTGFPSITRLAPPHSQLTVQPCFSQNGGRRCGAGRHQMRERGDIYPGGPGYGGESNRIESNRTEWNRIRLSKGRTTTCGGVDNGQPAGRWQMATVRDTLNYRVRLSAPPFPSSLLRMSENVCRRNAYVRTPIYLFRSQKGTRSVQTRTILD